MFQRLFSTIQPSNSSSSESEEIVDINMNLSEKLQTIMNKCNEDENFSNIERSQHIVKELAVFEST